VLLLATVTPMPISEKVASVSVATGDPEQELFV
jgi:hypothetical protein